MKFKKVFTALTMGFMALSLNAETVEQELIKNVQSQHPQLTQAPIKVNLDLNDYGMSGLYEINIGGQNMIVEKNGRYAFIGDFYDLKEMRNISEEIKTAAMKEKIKEVIPTFTDSDLVVFSPEEGVKNIGTLYVFTDPTCGYCQKLHHEVDQYLAAGVSVKYIPYPRSGVSNNGKDYNELKKIYCSDNGQQAMTDFKNGVAGSKYDAFGSEDKCHEMVEKGYLAGQQIGMSGTPFLYMSTTGDTIPGYNSASVIIERFKAAANVTEQQ